MRVKDDKQEGEGGGMEGGRREEEKEVGRGRRRVEKSDGEGEIGGRERRKK